jgi:hypothetical protein
MAMKIPFFHRDDKEDLLDIKEMIQRFETQQKPRDWPTKQRRATCWEIA